MRNTNNTKHTGGHALCYLMSHMDNNMSYEFNLKKDHMEEGSVNLPNLGHSRAHAQPK